MKRSTSLWPFAAAMAAVVAASNVLVQFPLGGTVAGVALADLLTWGAFTYPFAFLVTDLANRARGPAFARRVVYSGFAFAVACSLVLPPLLFKAGIIGFETPVLRLPRVALASGAAFLVGQLLDIAVFNRLRRQSWWRAPAVASVAGSVVDTAVFFTLAFAPLAAFPGLNDAFALESAPFMGAAATLTPRWVSWAIGDLAVKLLIAAVALAPYRALMDRLGVWQAATRPA